MENEIYLSNVKGKIKENYLIQDYLKDGVGPVRFRVAEPLKVRDGIVLTTLVWKARVSVFSRVGAK